MKRHPYKRTYEWSPNIAYSVGLMASDGWLGRDERHVSLTSVDLEQINNFVQAIEKRVKIATKKSGAGRFAYCAQFSDVAYYDLLINVGLTPVKSKTMPHLSIPSHLYKDFLRGYFDGDGSTYAYMDPRWRSSYMFYVQFTSASLEFIEYLQKMNSWLFKVSHGSARWSARAYILSYAKADSYKLYKAMYYSDEILCLSRKRVKLESFISRDRFGIIS